MVEAIEAASLSAECNPSSETSDSASPLPYASKTMVNETLHREYFAIAPMVDVSDKYFRYFMRLLTQHAFLYTEMYNELAVVRESPSRDRQLYFSENQHPVVL